MAVVQQICRTLPRLPKQPAARPLPEAAKVCRLRNAFASFSSRCGNSLCRGSEVLSSSSCRCRPVGPPPESPLCERISPTTGSRKSSSTPASHLRPPSWHREFAAAPLRSSRPSGGSRGLLRASVLEEIAETAQDPSTSGRSAHLAEPVPLEERTGSSAPPPGAGRLDGSAAAQELGRARGAEVAMADSVRSLLPTGGVAPRVKKAEFLKSSANVSQCPQDGKPEFALVGRSNVGKSSLINLLTNRRTLAETSKRPGKTQLINHFVINDSWYLVDLPGYGFAVAPTKVRTTWNDFTKEYFLKRSNLITVLLLVDASIPPQPADLECADWLGQHEIPVTVVFTKCDRRKKAKNGGRPPAENIREFEAALGESYAELPPRVMTSSVTGMGRDALLLHMAQLRKFWAAR